MEIMYSEKRESIKKSKLIENGLCENLNLQRKKS